MPKIKSEIVDGSRETAMSGTPTISPVTEKDEFLDSGFIDTDARLPRLQALRGKSSEDCGYFIALDEMARAGWFDLEPVTDRLVEYTYESSGNTAVGLLLPAPRMLVCPRSDLLAYDRAASLESEQLVILGHWKREYKEADNVGNLQMYEVILLDSDNRPLHSVPLSYIARGANQATFSKEWQKLCQEVTNCWAISNRTGARERDGRFKSLCVFRFRTARELVGKKQKSATCRVVGHDVPELSNWRDYFLGYDPAMKTLVWETLRPSAPRLSLADSADPVTLTSLPEGEALA